jgi:hypothetical protein
MKADAGVIYVLLEHFARHLYPRAVEMEDKLNVGGRLSDDEVVHVSEVVEELKLLRPLIDRHPEHRELAESVMALYAGIARRGWENETSPSNAANGAAIRP